MFRFTMLALAVLALCVSGAEAAPKNSSSGQNGKILECKLLGGTVTKQPKGSAITACCYEDGPSAGCWICDENGDDCVFDKAASTRHSPAKTHPFKLFGGKRFFVK